MTKSKFDGFKNYATWMINFHVFTGFDPQQELNYVGDDNYWKVNLPEVLREYAEETIIYRHEGIADTLLDDCARHFLSEVDWDQIAQRLLNQYTEA